MEPLKFIDKNVKNTFNSYPKDIRDKLLYIRELIFTIANEHEEIGDIEETLKWGNPSYLTSKPKSGTTIRLSTLTSIEYKYAISVHCQTTLIAEFKQAYKYLEFEGNRSIILDIRKELPISAIEDFLYLALTYHYRKNSSRASKIRLDVKQLQ